MGFSFTTLIIQFVCYLWKNYEQFMYYSSILRFFNFSFNFLKFYCILCTYISTILKEILLIQIYKKDFKIWEMWKFKIKKCKSLNITRRKLEIRKSVFITGITVGKFYPWFLPKYSPIIRRKNVISFVNDYWNSVFRLITEFVFNDYWVPVIIVHYCYCSI